MVEKQQPVQQKQQKTQQPFQQKQQQNAKKEVSGAPVSLAKGLAAANPDFRHIVRIGNKDIKGERKTMIALTEIQGVSYSISNAICNITKVNKFERIGNLKNNQIEEIEKTVTNLSKILPYWMLNRRKDMTTGEDMHLTTANLKLETENDIKFIKMIKSYKGIRHSSGQPVRGQRTKNRSRKNRQAKAKNKKMRSREVKTAGTTSKPQDQKK